MTGFSYSTCDGDKRVECLVFVFKPPTLIFVNTLEQGNL